MARLYEYQGKRLLKELGIPIPRGDVASSPEEVKRIAQHIGGPVVIKAQIWATGRFKAGGVKFAGNPEEAEVVSREILGTEIKGFKVREVLVEERLDIDKEYYIGVIVDDSYKVKAPVAIFSTEGGVDIEEVANKSPEKISKIKVDIFQGVGINDARDLVSALKIPVTQLEPLSKVVRGVYDVFRKYDARAVEINPLILTKGEKVYAGDCRVSIDDSSVFRHPELGIEVARESGNPPTDLETVAWKIEEGDYRGISYFAQMVPEIKEENYVGYHGIGGGGALLGVDALLKQGLKIANYADTSGNPTAAKVYRIAKVILSQPGIQGYFVSGCVMASQEQWHHARGFVKAFNEELRDKPGFPVVILLAGNKEKEAHEILKRGLENLPIRFEIYGRQYIENVDFVAERMKMLVEEYKKKRIRDERI